jgi:hypothetical protein
MLAPRRAAHYFKDLYRKAHVVHIAGVEPAKKAGIVQSTHHIIRPIIAAPIFAIVRADALHILEQIVSISRVAALARGD